jgi:hypothetical protein
LSAINLQHGLLSDRAEMAGGFGIEGRRCPARLSAARIDSIVEGKETAA